jgi:hypothetical protein
MIPGTRRGQTRSTIMIGSAWPARGRRRTLLLVLALLAFGCGYSIRPPFDTTIRTVYVPIFKSVSFHRDINLQLTQLVQDQIRRGTTFKVVGNPEEADTTLEGTIIFVDKNAQVENPNNLPRQLVGTIIVEVRWTDNITGATQTKKTPPARVVENVPFFPELGETTNLAFQNVMAKLARDIVSMMEEPW